MPAKQKINYDKVSSLASVFCTEDEIAEVLGMDAEKLKSDKKFQSVYTRSVANAKAELRSLQLELARAGNAAVMNWLGRQYLGQREKPEMFSKLNYDLTKLPDFYLERIIAGEDPMKVIGDYEGLTHNPSPKEREEP